jgi:SnoaL-like protein
MENILHIMRNRLIITSVVLAIIITIVGVYVVNNRYQNARQNSPNESAPASSDQSPQTTPPPASDEAAIDPAVVTFVDAVAAKSVDAVVDSFSADATVIDVTRSFEGREAIRQWAANELVGGSLRVLVASNYQGGQELLVELTPEGASSGFQAEYRFDVRDNKITKLDMQYPD